MINARPATNTHVFEHRSVIQTSLEQMIAFHEDPQALKRLTPPPPLMFMQVLRDERTSLTAGELEFRLWFGPFPIRWLARHEPGPTPSSFIDRQIEGPMASWEHQHIFTPVQGGVELRDRITLAHKPGLGGLITRLIFDGLPLRMLFVYRHLRTRLALRQ
jgi:ligand-binding SRPBCC domain-containing protein